MKAIIDGLTYNTDTAEKIGSASSRGYYSMRDWHYWSESLYRTKKGRWFRAGEGGALSPYGRNIGQNASTGGERIIPLDEAEALEWCEQHLDPDRTETLFKVEEA